MPGGRTRLLGMVGPAVVVLLLLLAAGRALGEALPLTATLACPLMMIGMVFATGARDRSGAESASHHATTPPDRDLDADGADGSGSCASPVHR